jgi:Protein of unknown function (DUF4244)
MVIATRLARMVARTVAWTVAWTAAATVTPVRSLRARISFGLVSRLRAGEAGMSTAEYAIGTVAACAFAAVLYKVITSTRVLDLLSGVVTRALHVPF